jgi:glycosyltransferase involved in cell wall biosynthesis
MRQDRSGRRILVVGSGTRFLSGISVYTVRLANALAESHRVSLITMRRLLPARLYPGWRRVGSDLTRLERDSRVSSFDGIDWFWLPSILRGGFFLMRHRPQIVIFEWWTGTVAHSYIALALLARLRGAKIIIEFHEIIETGEANIPLARTYIRAVAPILMRLAHAFAVHSEHDRMLVARTWRPARRRPIAILPHGPHDHYRGMAQEPLREAPVGTINVLFFGVIRPYKGLEHLITAFEAIPEDEIDHFWLTVVGETWEGWTLPTALIERSPRRSRITFVNRYVTDAELHGYLLGADAVALPYLRSSLSGPLHVAMAYGLPIVMTDVGGNVEAAQGYEGIRLVPPGQHEPLTDALREMPDHAGRRYQHPPSWDNTAEAYGDLFERLG